MGEKKDHPIRRTWLQGKRSNREAQELIGTKWGVSRLRQAERGVKEERDGPPEEGDVRGGSKSFGRGAGEPER